MSAVRTTPCRHVVIVAGNHDSPSLLEAPRSLLAHLHVYVVGKAHADHEWLELKNPAGEVELIVCAVPYLRDRELRRFSEGESLHDKAAKLQRGIALHYADLAQRAKARLAELPVPVPVLATGHLFASGGKTGDGVRELYVGSLAHVPASVFDPCFDYVALGHLHVPQQVNQQDHIRYSGAPLPMGFGEAKHTKQVRRVTFTTTEEGQIQQHNQALTIPRFQRLERLEGDFDVLHHRLRELQAEDESIWLEIAYTGQTLRPRLREQLLAWIEDSPLEILAVQNRVLVQQALQGHAPAETLDQLDPQEVFERMLATQNIDAAQAEQLKHSHREVVLNLHEMDVHA